MMFSKIFVGLTALVTVASAQSTAGTDSASGTASATSSSTSAAATFDVAVGAVWIPLRLLRVLRC